MRRLIFILIILMEILVSCFKFPEIGNGYRVRYDPNSFLIITDTLNTVIISGHVQDFSFDNKFILVKQKPVDSICECNPACFQRMKSYNRKSYLRCKEAFENSDLFKYWIIDKARMAIFDERTNSYSNVFGPFTKAQYGIKRIELSIPQELKLE